MGEANRSRPTCRSRRGASRLPIGRLSVAQSPGLVSHERGDIFERVSDSPCESRIRLQRLQRRNNHGQVKAMVEASEMPKAEDGCVDDVRICVGQEP